MKKIPAGWHVEVKRVGNTNKFFFRVANGNYEEDISKSHYVEYGGFWHERTFRYRRGMRLARKAIRKREREWAFDEANESNDWIPVPPKPKRDS